MTTRWLSPGGAAPSGCACEVCGCDNGSNLPLDDSLRCAACAAGEHLVCEPDCEGPEPHFYVESADDMDQTAAGEWRAIVRHSQPTTPDGIAMADGEDDEFSAVIVGIEQAARTQVLDELAGWARGKVLIPTESLLLWIGMNREMPTGCPACGRDIDRYGGNPDCPTCAAEPVSIAPRSAETAQNDARGINRE